MFGLVLSGFNLILPCPLKIYLALLHSDRSTLTELEKLRETLIYHDLIEAVREIQERALNQSENVRADFRVRLAILKSEKIIGSLLSVFRG